ncbi:MAG: hypothetical protein EOO28_16475 [Comamonadaceae bacterium]|nr:MAG: hypothetical protein EOO28_16475 [Comamonadaceae bacterium]
MTTPAPSPSPSAPAAAPTAADMTLSLIAETAGTTIKSSEDALAAAYKTLGPDSSPSELLKFQAQLTINSTVTAIFSALIKERSDTLKGICQKF